MTRGPSDIGDELGISAVNDSGKKSYPLVRIPNNVSYETVSEQPEAEPNQPLAWPLSFHNGVGYTKYDPRVGGAIHAEGIIANEPNVLRAPPKRNAVTLTGAANPPMYFFETVVNDSGADDGQPVLYVIANEAAEINVYKISLALGDFGTLLNTKTFAITPTQPCGKPVEWNDGSNTRWLLPLGDNGFIQRLDSVVSSTASDTWTSDNADARHLKIVDSQLLRSTDENQVSILSNGVSAIDENSWASDFPVGDKSSNITELGEASGLGYIAKEDGFYEWDLEGEAANVFPEIGNAPRNGQGMLYWHGGFLIPTAQLWWTRTGEPVGGDSNPNNRGNHPSISLTDFLKHGQWMGLAAFGAYGYGIYVNNTTSGSASVLSGRERDRTDAEGWGSIIWHVLDGVLGDFDDFHGIHVAETSEFGGSDVRPTLWFANGNNVNYIWLDRDGAPIGKRGDIELDAAGSITSGEFDFGFSRVPKQLDVIEGWAEDMKSGHSFQFSAVLDGSAIGQNVGSAITSDGFFQRFWTQDSDDTSRNMLIDCTWAGSSNLTDQDGPHLRDVMVRAIALPDVTREWTFLFAVEDEQGKTAKKIRSELEGYVGDLKKYTLPDRDTFIGVMGKIRMLRADEINRLTPRNQEPPTYVISAPVREVSGS